MKKVEIWDIFNVNPQIYRPFLLKKLRQVEKEKQLIIYGNSVQQKEIAQVFKEINKVS